MVLMTRATLLHLRIPFSFFLLPVFLFASYHSGSFLTTPFWILFLGLHLFLYPASNGFNSYFDQDEGPIGGLKNPPKADKNLYRWSLILDLLGMLLVSILGIWIMLGFLVYGLVSKAYSHPLIRLKSWPFLGWLSVALFQGGWVFLLTVVVLKGIEPWQLSSMDLLGAFTASMLLMGSYPMTQVYQHEEDRERGDRTLSLILGIKGTFLFTGIFFTLTMGLFFGYFSMKGDPDAFIPLLLILAPTLLYFLRWFGQVLKDPSQADFSRTMRLNLVSSACLNFFFLGMMLAWF